MKEHNYELNQRFSQFFGAMGAVHILKPWDNLEEVFGSAAKFKVMVMDGKTETGPNGETNDDHKASEERAA